jgi:hypothetical protein
MAIKEFVTIFNFQHPTLHINVKLLMDTSETLPIRMIIILQLMAVCEFHVGLLRRNSVIMLLIIYVREDVYSH